MCANFGSFFSLVSMTFHFYQIIVLNIQSGHVGLAIFSSMGLIRICEIGMHGTAEMENQLTSVERIIEYTQLPAEASLISEEKNTPPSDWPQFGNIEFKSLSLWYDRKEGTRILKNLSFKIVAQVFYLFHRN